jgi:TP901 family phage tail tape measure protein
MFKDAFSSGFTQAQNSLAGMKGALGELNKNQDMNRLAADLAMASSLTQPFRDGLSSLMDEPSRLAGTFESSMKNIQAITGKSASEIGTLGGELLKIGGESAAGPLAVAEAFNDVAGGVAMVSEVVPLLDVQMQVLNNALSLAEAGQANLGTAAEGLTKIMNSYRFTMGSVTEVNERAAWTSDVMTQAVGMGMGSMEEFVSAMAPISGVAASVGVGFDEIGSTMAYMTATTDSAATAGTKLSAFMTALQKPSDALATALASVGITSGSAMLAEFGLAESAMIVNRAFDGNQDAIAQAMGRQEAMKAVISLTADAYSGFAQQFGTTMDGVTAAAQSIQVESYESKLARLTAATDSLQIQIGGDINAIKGFFVDMGAGFLTHVVSPIMSSPVGEVFQGIAAGAGLAAKSVLDMGSGALNTATQLVMLTATLQNSGGFATLFKNSLGLITSPLKGIGTGLAGMGKGVLSIGSSIVGTLPKIGAWIASMWSVEAAHKAGAAIRAFPSHISDIGKSLAQAIPKMGQWITSVTRVSAVNAAASGKSLWSGIINGALSAGRSFISALPAVWAWIASGWATAAAWIAATWPILAVIGGIALLALGAVALVKNWDAVSAFFASLWNKITGAFSAAFDWIKNLLGGVSNKVLGVVAVFLPFIGIPALIIKNWETIQAFFAGLWSRITTLVTTAWNGIKNFFAGLWAGITAEFASAWNGILSFFNSVWNSITQTAASAANWFSGVWNNALSLFNSIWNGITQTVASAANWFSGVWEAVAGGFSAAWLRVSDFFTAIWEGIKGVVLGFVEWFSPVIDAIIAPFKGIANVIGGIIGAVGGWFGETVELGKTELSKAGENKTKNYAITPDQRDAALADTNVATALGYTTSLAVPALAPSAAIVPPPPITTTSAITPPSLTAQTGAGADAAGGAGKSLLNEHLAAASRKGIAGADISAAASGAFMGAGGQAFTGIDAGELEREAAVTFQAAVSAKTLTGEAPKPVSERRNEIAGNKVFNIQNVNLNTDDIHSLLDIARLLEMAVHEPLESAI